MRPRIALAATGEVAVDGADGDLRGIGRGARPAIGAGTTGRLQNLRADLLERREIAACDAIVANVNRAELQKQLHIGRDAQAALGRPLQHGVIVVKILALAGRAGATVGDVHARSVVHASSATPLPGSPGRATMGVSAAQSSVMVAA